MKRLLLVIAASVALSFSSLAQTAADSKGISFQGIARDNTGNVYASKTVNVTFTIQNGTTTVYAETQNGLTTDVAGVFSTYIGASSATVATGNKYSSFASVDFSVQYNIQVAVAINGGSSVTIGTYALQAVPYSKFATLAATATNATHATNADNATNGVPVGTIVAYGGATIPTGWLLCDGSTVSRTTYSNLFTALNLAWGNGDGTTNTFSLPNMSGMFLRGVGAIANDPGTRSTVHSGGNTGYAVGSYETDAFASHTHQMWDAYLIKQNAGLSTNPNNGSDTTTFNPSSSNGGTITGTTSHSTYTNLWGVASEGQNSSPLYMLSQTLSTGGTETRPKNVYVYYIIKY